MYIVHMLDLAMSLRKRLVLRIGDCSGLDKKPLMVAVEAVKVVQKEHEELKCKGLLKNLASNTTTTKQRRQLLEGMLEYMATSDCSEIF